jgi:hypothetical protein
MTEESDFNNLMRDSLAELVLKVERSTAVDILNLITNHINERLELLEKQKLTDEFDYCEFVGRTKELEELINKLKEIKQEKK